MALEAWRAEVSARMKALQARGWFVGLGVSGPHNGMYKASFNASKGSRVSGTVAVGGYIYPSYKEAQFAALDAAESYAATHEPPVPTPSPGPSPEPAPGPSPSPWDDTWGGDYDWERGSAYVAEGPYSYTWGAGSFAADSWAPGTSAWDYPSMWYDQGSTGAWNVTSAWTGFTSAGGWDSGGTWGAGDAGGGWLSRAVDWFTSLFV